MSIKFAQCVTYTTIDEQGKWSRCNDHPIEAGTTYTGVLDSLEQRFPKNTFAEIAWEVPDGIVWMDDLVQPNFDPRYHHQFMRDDSKMAPVQFFAFVAV